MELKPVAYELDETMEGDYRVHKRIVIADVFESMSNRGEYQKEQRAVPLYAIPEGYAITKIKAPKLTEKDLT